jgi:hypothetical protein
VGAILQTVNQSAGATAIDVASRSWAFTQNEPLDIAEFVDESKKRGVHLRTPVLREFYRHRLLVPFVQLTHKPVREAAKPDGPESPFGGTRLMDLRSARDTGRLRDPAAAPYQPRLSFEPTGWSWPSSSPWTGVMYSPYQLLVLPDLEALLAKATYHKRGARIIARLPEPSPVLVDQMERLRRAAIALTAVEARYLPNLDPEFIQLTNVGDPKEWANYRAGFDPLQAQAWLAYPSDQLRQDAERLLSRAHSRDPVGDNWSQLMRRAPAKARKYLKDAALLAMDDRIAAEILLRFYEDLALRGQAEPLPDLSGSLGWHPLVERLSFRRDTLDENLVDLGISPYPRVVLALEGETEAYHAPLVWRTLGYSEAPELMRLLKLGGVDQKLHKVAALNVAPLIGHQVPAPKAIAWTVIRPSATLILAVDPDNRFNTPDKVAKERTNILNEVKDVLKAQGVKRPNPEDLDHLVEIRVWDAPCYEFEHFDDEELAEGIMTVHWTIEGWTREQLVEALRYWRDVKKQDIKYVWLKGRWDDQANRLTGKWAYEVSKTKLAEALWPTLLRKIRLAMVAEDVPVPTIMEVVSDTYHLAQQRRYLSFVLTEVPEDPT